jgi:hypothetical protein
VDRQNDSDLPSTLALIATIQADLDRLRALVEPQASDPARSDPDREDSAGSARPLTRPLVWALTDMPAIDEELVVPSA